MGMTRRAMFKLSVCLSAGRLERGIVGVEWTSVASYRYHDEREMNIQNKFKTSTHLVELERSIVEASPARR